MQKFTKITTVFLPAYGAPGVVFAQSKDIVTLSLLICLTLQILKIGIVAVKIWVFNKYKKIH
jgi:hypothetical protein